MPSVTDEERARENVLGLQPRSFHFLFVSRTCGRVRLVRIFRTFLPSRGGESGTLLAELDVSVASFQP